MAFYLEKNIKTRSDHDYKNDRASKKPEQPDILGDFYMDPFLFIYIPRC